MSVDNWFADSRLVIGSIFGEDTDLFFRLLAATSPLSTIETNVVLALRAYRHLKWFGHIPDRSFIHTHSVCMRKFLDGTMDNSDHTYNKWRKYTAGRKVWSLYQNLAGNEQVCPIDRWMLRYFGYPGDTRVTVVMYDELESRIRGEAAKLGITPAARQVQIWCASRSAGSSREDTSYGDILRKRGICRQNVLSKLL